MKSCWPQGKRNWTVRCQADDPAADSTPAVGQMTLVEVVRPIIGTVTLSRHLGACNALLGVAGPRRRVNPTLSNYRQIINADLTQSATTAAPLALRRRAEKQPSGIHA